MKFLNLLFITTVIALTPLSVQAGPQPPWYHDCDEAFITLLFKCYNTSTGFTDWTCCDDVRREQMAGCDAEYTTRWNNCRHHFDPMFDPEGYAGCMSWVDEQYSLCVDCTQLNFTDCECMTEQGCAEPDGFNQAVVSAIKKSFSN